MIFLVLVALRKMLIAYDEGHQQVYIVSEKQDWIGL